MQRRCLPAERLRKTIATLATATGLPCWPELMPAIGVGGLLTLTRADQLCVDTKSRIATASIATPVMLPKVNRRLVWLSGVQSILVFSSVPAGQYTVGTRTHWQTGPARSPAPARNSQLQVVRRLLGLRTRGLVGRGCSGCPRNDSRPLGSGRYGRGP
jgi:hypothetical protein